jgi:hypothetical protein
MKDFYYVVFNRTGIDRFLKTDRFQLKGGEYAQRIDFEVDDELFKKVQIPKVTLHVGQDQITMARSVEPEVEDARDVIGTDKVGPLR